MATAREIACTYGDPDRIDDLERAILRHMEQHILSTATVEREVCARIADNFGKLEMETYRDMTDAPVVCEGIAASIRARNK